MTPLQRQSNKAQKITSVISVLNGYKHHHITACHSVSEPHLLYEQEIKPIGKEIINGHKVIIYKISCSKVLATGLEPCKGNEHTHTLCQHSLSGVRAVVKHQGKVLKTAKLFKNVLKSKGQIVKLVGESGFTYGVVS